MDLPQDRRSRRVKRVSPRPGFSAAVGLVARVAVLLAGAAVAETAVAADADLAPIADGPKLFRRHCHACHKHDKAEGGFDVDDLAALPEPLRRRMRLIHLPDHFDREESCIGCLEEGVPVTTRSAPDQP